jgi:hypothetical protein
MKKLSLLAALLTLSLCFSSLALADFTDVDEDTSYQNSIEWMNQNQVVTGHPDGTFTPDTCVNRADFLIMLFRTMEMDLNDYDAQASSFSDVSQDVYYNGAVNLAAELGLVSGFEDGSFKPGQCMTRAEAIKVGVLGFNDGEIPEFEKWWEEELPFDVSSEDWFYDYMDYALWTEIVGEEHSETAITSGNEYFFPNEEVSRKEVAEMLFRMLVVEDNALPYYYSYYNPYPLAGNQFADTCSASEGLASYELESVLPSDVSFIMAMDWSDEDQMANWETLMARFPDTGLKATIIALYDESVSHDDLKYESNISPIVNDGWKFLFGAQLYEDIDWTESDIGNMELYFAGHVGASEEFESLLGLLLQKEYGSDLDCRVEDGVAYWTNVEDEFYYARMGDLFVLSNTAENLDAGLARVEDGSGFELNYGESNIGYIYADAAQMASSLATVFEEIEAEIGTPMSSFYLDELGILFGELKVNADSFQMESWEEISIDGELANLYAGYESTLTSVLPGENLLLYTESGSLNAIIESTLASMNFSELGVTDEDLDLIWTELGIDGGLDFDDLIDLTDNPFAFAAYGLEDTYPGVIFALDLSDGNVQTGNMLSSEIDTLLETAFEGLNASVNLAGLEGDFLILDTDTQGQGDNLHFASVNHEDFDEDDLSYLELTYGTWIHQNLELAYGTLVDEEVFLFAFYPDLDEALDGYTLNKSNSFQSALSDLDGVETYLTYINVGSFVSWADDFIRNTYFAFDPDYLDSSEEYGDSIEWMSTFDTFISGSQLEDGVVHTNAFLNVD